MKGQRQANWDPDLGLAILAATQDPPHAQQVIANYMGSPGNAWNRLKRKRYEN
jgi:hypothetical protein